MSIQYAGGTIVSTTFTSASKAAFQASVIANLLTAGWSQATGPASGGAQTVTIAIASPGVVTLANHGLLANDQVVFSTSGALPTGLTAGAVYYVKTVVSSSTFTVSASSGGSVINTTGSQSGTHTMVGCVRMATAATPWSVTARIRIADNGGACVVFSIENSNSTLAGANSTSFGAQMNPNASVTTFRMIANKYQAFILGLIASPARSFVAFGTLYLPSFLQGVITECGWMQSNSQSDAGTTLYPSLRTFNSLSNAGLGQGIINSNLFDEQSPGTGYTGQMQLLIPHAPGAGFGTQTGTHWHDASALMSEPLLMWSTTAGNAEPLIRGQLWDAVLIADTFAGDTTSSFDSHTWWNITDNDTANKTSLFVAKS